MPAHQLHGEREAAVREMAGEMEYGSVDDCVEGMGTDAGVCGRDGNSLSGEGIMRLDGFIIVFFQLLLLPLLLYSYYYLYYYRYYYYSKRCA